MHVTRKIFGSLELKFSELSKEFESSFPIDFIRYLHPNALGGFEKISPEVPMA